MTALAEQSRMGRTLEWSPPLVREPSSRVMEVGPGLATHFLTFNTRNRNIRARDVDKLARDMENGHWVFNGDAIRFDWNGRLIDGQHRLSAIVQSGMIVRLTVIWGLDPSAQDVTDCGIIRKMSDILTLHGKTNTVVTAAALRLICRWNPETGLSSFNGEKVSVQDILACDKANPELAESAAFASTHKHLRMLFTPSGLVFCHFLFSKIDPVQASEFFDSIETGADLAAGDPRLVLSRQLNNQATRTGGGQYQRQVVALTIKAWNSWKAGATCGVIRWSGSEKFPIPR